MVGRSAARGEPLQHPRLRFEPARLEALGVQRLKEPREQRVERLGAGEREQLRVGQRQHLARGQQLDVVTFERAALADERAGQRRAGGHEALAAVPELDEHLVTVGDALVRRALTARRHRADERRQPLHHVDFAHRVGRRDLHLEPVERHARRWRL